MQQFSLNPAPFNRFNILQYFTMFYKGMSFILRQIRIKLESPQGFIITIVNNSNMMQVKNLLKRYMYVNLERFLKKVICEFFISILSCEIYS